MNRLLSDATPGAQLLDLTVGGARVTRVVLSDGTLTVALLSLGCALQDLRLTGLPYSLTIGSSDPAEYLGAPFSAGVLVGPVANRIAGATAVLDGRAYRFDRNDLGRHTLHSGAAGIQHKVWDIAHLSATEVTFRTTLAAGEGGFPGTRQIAACFALTRPGRLDMTLTAATSAPTWINLANHSYWNLDGSEDLSGHRLSIAAEQICVTDAGSLATGALRPVAGTPYDFRSPRALRPGADPVLDHNFCLATAPRQTPVPAVTLTGASGVTLQMTTTEPGVQIFDGHILGGPDFTRHDGIPLRPYAGLAIEAQGWPDAPNQPYFPPVVLRPGATYRQITCWQFTQPATGAAAG
ncbi:MAG: galactose mutarotase [Rhodobacteraceae bacterium]|nr:galactose mutarotase [Paracoccaceae bacterium]